MAKVAPGQGQDLTENELSEELLKKNPLSSKANFLAGYLKGGKDKVLQTATSEHAEVTCRMSLSMFIGYVVMFADIRWITPIDQAAVVGIFVPFIALLFPTLMFSFGLMLLPMISIFLMCFISATVLLAIAEAGGTAWFIVSFTLWAFWICSLRWDKAQGTKVSLILIGVVLQAFLVFPTFETVQHGFTLPAPPASVPPSAQKVLLEYLAETIAAAVAMGAGSHDIMVESGVLEGRMAVVTVNEDGTASTFIEGGQWLVRGMWTFSGVNNPLAAYQSSMIAVVSTIVIISVIPLLPPFRTMRSAVWRGMIPGALMDAAALLRLHVDKVEKEGSPTAAEDGSLGEVMGKIGQLLGKCVFHMNALYEGNIAKFTFFEPRVLDCKPAECTGGYLMHLCMLVTRVVSATAGITLFTNRDFCYHNMDQYLLTAKNLETCAKALALGNMSILDSVELNSDAQEHDTFTMHQRTVEIVHVARRYLGAMTGEGDRPSFCSKESMQASITNTRPWIDVHFSHFWHLARYLVAPLRKYSYQKLKDKDSYAFVKLLWCIKYALGMGLLCALSVYWPAYQSGFAVADEDDPLRELYSVTNGGWVIIAYCFATTQTAEGSVKKGLLRMLGTVTGSFSAWLALVACEDARFKGGFNPYGLVAWLTITSAMATYLSTQRGFLARVSLASDYSFGPIYFVITQVIVVIGCAIVGLGPGARDAITVNRMVANLVGIAMGTLVAVIPPGNYGGDPGHTKKINDFHWHSVRSVLERACDSKDMADGPARTLSKELLSSANDIVKTSAKMLELTSDFQADAARLQSVPFFRVDPMLKMQIGLVTRDNHVASFIPRLLAKILESDVTRPLLVEKDGIVQKKLGAILNDMKRGGIGGGYVRPVEVDFHLPSSELVDSRDDIDLLVRVSEWLIAEMRAREQALQKIEWGAFQGLMGPIKK